MTEILEMMVTITVVTLASVVAYSFPKGLFVQLLSISNVL